ncbi:MAG TPA: riboflavin biosynthesis protein RibF [Pirellulales bacterium]|nr:riboflavin biosynthesis protein RibF [Pirellulales bacterium]
MKLLRELADVPDELREGALTIGNFDGVHLGHARLIERLIELARQVDGPAVVFTFDPHPVRLLRPERAPWPLTWTDRKAQLLGQLGVDWIIAYPTDEALLALSDREFFGQIVRDKLAARAMVEGPNFFFGHNRTGNIDVLGKLAGAVGMQLDIVEPVVIDGTIVSSSRVRELISAGKVDAALPLLTQPYRIRGIVTHGAGRGARIGFATANLAGIDTLLPGAGVYAGRAILGGQHWPAAINVGANPTFGEGELKVEAHLIGFHGAIYGEPLEVDFLGRLRDVRPFGGIDELKRQLAQDVEAARTAVERFPQ